MKKINLKHAALVLFLLASTGTVARADNDRANAYVMQGFAKQTKGDYDGAILDYNKAIEIEPSAVNCAVRAGAKVHQNDVDGAIADYTRAIETDPNGRNFFSGVYTFSYYASRGELKNSKGDYAGAIADWEKMIELKPELKTSYQSKIDLSRAKLNGAGTNAPQTAADAITLGNAAFAEKDYDSAIAYFTRAIALDPQSSVAYLSRGATKNSKGDHDGAIADETQAITLNPQYTNAYFSRGYAKKNKGDYAGALADFAKTIEVDPSKKALLQPWIDELRAKLNQK